MTAAPKRIELNVGAVGRVEGDLDVRVVIEDGVVVDAWTEAAMFRGFEIILRGKDPQAGLIVTPRICGICGGSHLTKAVYALDTAWKTQVPHNATLVRNIAQASETLQSIPRWFYALFAIDFVNKAFAHAPSYAEVVKRWSPFVGTSYENAVYVSAKPVEIYALFGGQWPHSSFMVPGGVMCGPTLSDVTRATALLEFYRTNWLEPVWLGGSLERYLEIKSWKDLLAYIDENDEQRNSDLALWVKICQETGMDKIGVGPGKFISTGSFFDPESYEFPTIDTRNKGLKGRSGIYDGNAFHDFDQANVREFHTSSFYKGEDAYHPFDGFTEPIDPRTGRKEGKYSYAKSPRYNVGGELLALEAGPLSRQIIAGREGALKHQNHDPFILDVVKNLGPSVFTRVLARMHEAAKYTLWVREWLSQLDLHDKFYIKPEELESGRGFGSTEAARGALSDWIILEGGKIKNYQVITPTAWNIGPRDKNGQRGPIEQALIGTPIRDPNDPQELGIIARSYDSCLVCTVHAYDKKTGREIAQYRTGAVC